ncbi:MAG TPA: hypothetical protein DHW07_04380 [Gammaproteobacteria bacterium]|nr:hypothetical protein [Gammaproteobacteria bacterium]
MRNIFIRLLSSLVIAPVLLLSSGEILSPSSAFAQGVSTTEPEAVLDQNLSAEARKELLARLSDEQVRNIVWGLLQTETTSIKTAEDSSILKAVDQISDRLRNGIAGNRKTLSTILQVPGVIGQAMIPPGRTSGFIFLVVLTLAALLLVGWIAQRLMNHLSRQIPESLQQTTDGISFPERLARRFLLLLYDLLTPVVFVLASYIAFLAVYQGYEPNRLLIVGILAAILTAWTVKKVINFVFSPHRPESRLTPLSDGDSRLLSSRLSIIVILGAALFFFSNYLQAIAPGGATDPMVRALNSSGGITLMLLIIVVMWLVRRPVGALLLSGKPAGIMRRMIANLWPVFGTVFVVLITVIGVVSAIGLQQEGVLGSVLKTILLVLIAYPLLLGSVGPLIREWGVSYSSETRNRSNGQSGRDGIVQTVRIVILLFGLVILGKFWNVDLVALMQSSLGERVGAAAGQILITILVAHIAIVFVSRWASSQTAGTGEDSEEIGGDPGGQGLSRIATILPLLRGFLLVSILTVAAMIVLASLGVSIGPLIAAASVLGLAIGFGAQTLVSDIISGIFFLVDDAFRKGEYIDVGGNTGTVEQISVRSMQLRHHNGPIHTIPYSQIKTLTNFSRDWVIMKFELRIPFEEDVEKVRKLIKKVGQKMLEDPEHGPQFLDPLKSQGVNRMDDSAFVVRCKFSAKPGNQWALRRVAYANIQAAFSEAGIKFAPKRVVVEAITPTLAAAGAAAQETANDAPSASGDDR